MFTCGLRLYSIIGCVSDNAYRLLTTYIPKNLLTPRGFVLPDLKNISISITLALLRL